MRILYSSTFNRFRFLFFAISLLFSLIPNADIYSQTVVVNPTSPWIVPAGVTSVKVEVWGGGGGGGGVINYGAGGGGGGGAYNTATITVLPAQSYTITIGAGGAGGVGGAYGQNGFQTIFAIGATTLVSATGGSGGVFGSFGNFSGAGTGGPGASGGIPIISVINGGTGANSSYPNFSGGGGGGAGNFTAGGAGAGATAGVGGTGSPNNAPYIGGNGGAGRSTIGNGNPGSTPAPGGGGSGALDVNNTNSYTGGAGGSGQVVLTYTVNLTPTIISLGSSSGCAGSSITINGTNLTGATAAGVTIGGTAVSSITSNSGTQIIAVIGSGTNGFVQVTTPGGTATSGTSFTVNPLPTLYSVGGTGAYCSTSPGGDVTLSGSQNGVSYQLFRGATALATMPGTGSALDFGFQTTAGTYTVVATNATGCTATMTGSAVITITTAPNTTFTYSSYNFCATGTSPAATLSGSPTTGSFSASPAGLNFSSTTTGAINLATSTPGTYAITYTIAASGGCATYTYTQPTSIVISALPTLYSVGGTGAYCSTSPGGDVTLSGSQNGVSYQLFRGATALATMPGTGSALDFGFQTTAGTYTVVATNATGCTATMTGSAVITITTAPNTTFTYSSYNFCATGTSPAATLSGFPTTGSFSASPAGLNFSSTTTGAINLATSTPGTYAITYTIGATGGCAQYTYTQPTNVVINATPTLFTVTGSGAYCSTTGGDVQLTGSQNGVSYQLFRGATALATMPGTGSALDFGFQTTAGTYTVVATNATGCTATMTGSAVITITTAPNTTFTYSSYNFCATGTSPAATLSGSPATGSFSASPAGLNFSNTNTGAINLATSTPGTYAITYTIGATGGCTQYTYTQPTNVVINATPTTAIAGSNQTLCTTTTSTTLTANTPVNGTGAWSITSGPSTSVTQFSDVTNPTATFTPAGGAGTYSLKWTISNGPCTASSSPVNIVVNTAPSITSQPANQTTCAGTAKTFSVTASGTSPTYQWQYSPDGTTWTNVVNGTPANITYSGSTGATLTVTPSSSAINGTYYYRALVSVNGCSALNSNSATLAVSATPSTANAGSNQTLCSTTGSTTLTANTPVNGTGAWSITSGPSTSVTQFSDVTNPTATFTPAGGAGTYVLKWTISNGPCTASSSPVNIVVNTAPSITSQPANQTTCAGTAKTFSVTASGTSPTYQWQYSPDGTTWTNVVNGTPANITYSGSTGATLTVTPSSSAINGTYYYRALVSVNGCSALNSNSATLAVSATPSTANAGSNQTLCSTTGSTTLTANTPVNGTGAWSITSGPSTSVTQFSDVTNPTATFTPAGGAGTYSLKWTISNGPCTASSSSVNIVVNTAPSITSQPSNQTTCAGTAKTFSVTASGTSPTYQWQYSPNGTTWTNVVNGTPANITYSGSTGATLTVTPSSSAINGTYYYRALVSVNGCSAVNSNSATLTVNINATISLSSAAGTDGQSLCANSPLTNITYAIGGSGTGASITAGVLPAGVTGSFAGGVFTISGIPTASGTFNYTVTYVGPCTTPSLSGTITVIAAPTGSFTATETSGVANNDSIICAGDNVTFMAPAGYNAYTFYVNGVVKQGPNTSNVFSTSALINGDQVTVNVANINNCGTAFGPITITVNQPPVPTLSADNTTICAGQTVTFTAGGGGAGSVYTFELNGNPVQSGSSTTYTNNTLNNNDKVTVLLTNANKCSATYATPIVITVNGLPSGTLTSNPSPAKVCAGNNITFTATPSGLTSYEFFVSGVSQGVSGSNTFSSTILTNGSVVTVKATNSSTCSSTFNAIPVTIYALPAGSLAVTESSGTPNDNIICAGAPVTFTFTPTTGNTFAFYLNGAGSPLPSGGLNTYTSTTLSDGDYVAVVVTNSNGCSQTFNSPTIKVNPVPTGNLNISPSNTICAGDNARFAAPDGYSNYTFKINGSAIYNGPDSIFNTTTLTDGKLVTVDVTNSNGCISTFGPITMHVNALPTGTLMVSPSNTVCAGAIVVFTATSGFTNYNFLLNGASIQSGPSNVYTTSSLHDQDKVTVTVTNGSGCVALFNSFTITVNALPTVAPITGTMSVCVNSTTTLADVTGGGTWSSSDVTKATVDASTGVVTGVAAGTADIIYTVTNANGCSQTSTATVTVNALPVVAAIGGSSDVCVNSTLSLTDGTSGGTWSTSDGTVATVDGSGNVTGLANGTVTISYSVTNVNGCTTIVNKTINVHALPVVPAITGTFSVCVNSTTPLTDATAGGVWSSGNSAIATINSSSGIVTGVAAGTATISYVVTDGNGCSTSVMQDIVVNALPIPTLTGPNPICLGSTNNVYTTETGSGIHNYLWNVVNGTVTAGGGTSDNTITISWLTAGAKSISVNYTDINGCVGAAFATVVNAPGTSPTVSGLQTVCQGTTGVTYTAPSGEIDYSWTISSGGTITAGGTSTDPTVTVTWNGSGAQSVTINYADPGGCNAASPTVWPVTVNPLPTLKINDPAAECSPSTVDLTAATVTAGSTSGLTFTYYTDAAGTTTLASPNAVATSGTYYIKGTTAAGCSDVIKPVTVTINPLPTLVINTPAAVCAPSTIDLTATAVTAGSTAGLTFTYYTDAAGTTALASPNAVATSGTYYIKGTTAAGCSDVIKPVTITINPLPTLVINNPAAVCAPATIDLTATAVTSGSTSGLTFTYYTDAAGTTTLASPNAVATSGTYYIKGTTAAGCSDVIKPVTVTINPLPTLVINTPAAVCAPSTIDLTATAVTAGSTAGLTFTYYTDAAGTTALASPNAVATSGTYYIKGTTAAGCSDVIKPVTITINPLPTLVINNPAAVCAPSTIDLTATAVTAGSTSGLTFTYYTDAGGTTTLTSPTTVATSGTYYIKGTTGAGCSDAIKPVTVTINPLPTITGTLTICAGSTTQLTGSGAPAASNPWISGTTSVATVNTTGLVTGVSAGNSTITYTGSTGCSTNATVTVSAIPTTPVATATPSTICQGSSSNLVVNGTGGGGATTIVNYNFNSGNSYGALAPTFATGITSTVSSGNISFNTASGTATDGAAFTNNPTAGNALNDQNPEGTWTFTLSGSALPSYSTFQIYFQAQRASGGSNTIAIAYSKDGGATVNLGTAVTLSNSGNWYDATITLPNGANNPASSLAISLIVGNSGNGDVKIDNFQVQAIGPANTNTYSWIGTPSATAGLPANAGTPLATNSNINVTPTVTTNYTVTATNSTGCSNNGNVTVTVTPTPVVTVSADYCIVPGKVVLTASSVPTATTYLWNTGGTQDTIQVKVAGNYTVTVSAGGCPGTGNITVAQNLVVNGDFSGGYAGFTSVYAQAVMPWNGSCNYPNPTGLLDEGLYAVSTNGQLTHCNFWGHDHTTGSGNFMLINGAGNNPLLKVWQETVSVLPNTTYYFSAWGMSLNNAEPFASLQFNINNVQAGTIDNLAPGVDNNNNGTVASGAPWSQFYGTWTSGPTTTTAIISITDLQTEAGGNDFGLDDINFGTLSPFIYLVSAPGTDAQTPCVNTPITPIVYSVGSTSAGPTISSPLPAGLTGTFTPGSGLYTITGTPTVAGNYTYTLTTTGTCNPTSASGTINIQSQTIALSSGNANPVQCKTSPVNIGFTLGGTATGATITGLPVGVSGGTSGNTYTISGTPNDTAGVYHYSIITSGSSCNADTVAGTITLQQQTITHNSGDSLQTVCINTPIDNIQYTISGPGSLNGTVTGLPGGVSYTYNSGILIISGTPNVAGTFKYYVIGSGSCTNAKDSGVITVTADATLTLTSAAGTDGQSICINSPITDITYSVNNATDATVSGLPAGVTAGPVSGGVLTITGTPTEAGTFTYTITTSGGCGTGEVTGTITVESQTIDLTTGTKSPTLCENTSMTPIVFTIGGAATGANVSGLPTGVGGLLSGNTLTISGTPTVSGTFQYIITVTGSCATPAADTGTITVQQTAIGGDIQLVSTLVCAGSNASMTLMDYAGTIIGWESSVDGGTTWTGPNGNTSISENATNVLVPTLWRVEISNGCGNVYSSTAAVNIHNYWTGSTNTDWNTAANWSDNLVPSTVCPTVVVPLVAINKYPVLSSGPMATITNLQIAAGASVTITGNTIQIAGTITNGGIFDLTDGTLELNGTATQNIDGNSFANAVAGENNTVKNLIISNNVDVAATANDTLNITGTLSFGTSSAQLATGNNITLKSSYSATANVGVLASGNAINGDVTVERYINSGSGANNHGVSWQHLATPTQGQSVYQSWMENGITASTGYGTQVTDASYPANGFDALSPSPSMKVYNFATNGYTGIPNTAIQLYNKKGYLVFVRGDRSIAYPNVGPTVLRSKGILFGPSNLPPVTTVILGDFESVGNPYASAIDIHHIGFDAYTSPTIYVWDPSLTTYPQSTYGYGGFQTLYLSDPTDPASNYTNLLSTPDYPAAAGTGIYNYIQSGQAFFVTTALGSTNNGTVTFTENAKANGSQMLFRQQGVTGNPTQLRADLDVVNSDSTSGVRDANLIQYSTAYSNKIDILDARKMINSAENLGILSGGHDLVIERRAGIQNNDTIFYNLTGLRVQKYKIVFTASGLSAYGLQGYIEDTYLNTRTPLNMEGSTETGFTVTNAAGSYAANRFRIVFAPQPPTEVALTFISLTAHQQDADIAVNWKVKNEKGMQQYEVETSMDGVNFTKAATVTALNNGVGSYQWIDKNVTAGDHYYRIRCIAGNGSISYSTVVKVTVVFGNPSISIHPNPITDGVIHLQFVNQPQGRYGIRLLNSLGQLIVAKQIELAGGGNATENIQWNYYLAHGVYQLEITRPDGSVKVIKVLY